MFNMRTKKLYLFPLFTLLLFVVCSCKDDNNDPTPPEPTPGITIPSTENLNPVLSQEGGKTYVSFTATADWTASLVNTRAESWITVSPTSGTKGDHTITITASANETYDERNATVVLKCGTVSKNIVVAQKQKDALTVTSSKYEVDGNGGNISVEVKANISFEVEVKADWIKQVKSSNTRALTTSNLNFTIEPNETGDKREGEIIIKNGELSETIKVYQGFENFITLTQRDFTLPEEGGNVDIEIKSTLAYEMKILSDVDWITEVQSRAVSTHTHHYTIAPNETYDSREAKIVFYDPKDENMADTVSIFQMYKGAILVARNEYQFDVKGGNLNLTVQTNLDIDIEVSDSWIQQVQPTRALTEYNLSFAISKNTEQKDREGTIIVKDKNSEKKQVVTVKQSYVDLEHEREALIALYKATNGDNWTNNTNWCSDKPISEWYGISTWSNGAVQAIILQNNNLKGVIPEEIGQFKEITVLNLYKNFLTGSIPSSIGNLTSLNQSIDLANNKLTGSIPSSIGNLVNLKGLYLGNNRLTGSIPPEIGNMTSLKGFDISNSDVGAEGGDVEWGEDTGMANNEISGQIPLEICKLPNLEYFSVGRNKLSGDIPSEIWSLPSLVCLQLDENQFTGEITHEIRNAKKIKVLWLGNNLLKGELPEEIYELTELEELRLGNQSQRIDGTSILTHNRFEGSLSEKIRYLVKLRSLVISNAGFSGEIPNTIGELSRLEELRIGNSFDPNIYNNFVGSLPESIGNLKELKDLDASDAGLGGVLPISIYNLSKLETLSLDNTSACNIANSFSGEISENIRNLKNLISLSLYGNNFEGNIPEALVDLPKLQSVILLDNRLNGVVPQRLSQSPQWKSWNPEIWILPQQEGYILSIDSYTSTDFSKDGEMFTLQTHSKGNGIKLVLMGDAFVDTDMEAGGKYETMMKKAMDSYFSVEPFKSLREYYDVVGIKAVSKNDWIGKETVFETKYSDNGTYISGNNDKCMEYAQKALNVNDIEDVQVITVLNDVKYAGTCHMYSNGFSIAYCPYVNNSDQSFGEMIHHEANGHGFGFLGDEYAYEGVIPQSEKENAINLYNTYGWFSNIDFTSNPSEVKWNHFIADSRYDNEGIGVFEGAYTYSKGAFRPTVSSIMVDNTGLFNAPSREAIYKRAMKIANGGSWVYNYEDFVSFDAPTRTSTRTIKHYQPRKDFKPTVPPVIYNYPAVVK